jgi:hypothetical protein
MATVKNYYIKLIQNALTHTSYAKPIPRSRVLPEKLIVTQLVKKSPAYAATSQRQPDDCPYPEPDAPSPQSPTLFP